MKLKNNLLVLCFLFASTAYSQDFHYKAALNDVNDVWHNLVLDSKVLSNVKSDMSDIRIYEVNAKQDTLEVPYFIETKESSSEMKGVNFKILNQVKKDGDYYITLKVKNKREINEIDLSLAEENYDYKLDLEGSQNQNEWFEVVKDYRILNISNSLTDYEFNKISFKEASYKFYRIKIKDVEEVNLKSASVQFLSEIKGNYNEYKNNWIQENEDNKSLITINLNATIPVSKLNLELNDTKDFYRIIKIKYLVDSVKTDKGWYYNYKTVAQDYVSSLEKSSYSFETVFTNKLQVEIVNNDNQALIVKKVNIKGPVYTLTARFNKKGEEHYMLFGAKNVYQANYDIVNFKKKIPKNLKEIELGNIETLIKEKEESSFLNNKMYLWAILILIILVLGGASFSMLKKKN